MRAQVPEAMGGKGSGRKPRPEDVAMFEALKRAGVGAPPPQAYVDKAKVTGGRILRKAAKARRKRGGKR